MQWSECRACGRRLNSQEARSLGYGRDCARKRGLTPRKPRRPRPVRLPKPATVPPAADVIPGQEALDLFYFAPTLDSL